MKPEATPMTDQLLDDAACDALGVLSPVESAAYQQDLAVAGPTALQTDRELRETTARLAAASPHMAPPADLRGRILQATAPVTFRMEDYRKVTREDFRFYKWGFYAAACFLVAAALYNINTKSSLDRANAHIAALGQQRNQLAVAAEERNKVIAALINPDAQLITWTNPKPYARAFLNAQDHTAVLICPEESIPAGTLAQLKINGDAYKTTLITAPAAQLKLTVTDLPKGNMGNLLDVKSVSPDTSSRPLIAGK